MSLCLRRHFPRKEGEPDLYRYLAPKGLFFPVDPAPGAKIGGMVSLPKKLNINMSLG